MKPEYLMLAQTFKPGKFSMAGWFLSEKLDGIRAYWDGGLSRGVMASRVPYANTIKDYRLKQPVEATGLWSRTGKVIHAPDHWLDELPNMPLDGELWIDVHSFQELTSIVSTKDGSRDADWVKIKYMVFDSPPFMKMFADRTVKVRDYEFEIKDAMDFYRNLQEEYMIPTINSTLVKWNFEMVQDWLVRKLNSSVVKPLPQYRLPFNHHEAMKVIDNTLETFLGMGSEGVILRNPISKWIPERSHMILKHKPWSDAEATITGFTSGKETEKGSRLLGMIGALIVDYKGKRLELSGLTDEERRFSDDWSRNYAADNPGEDMPNAVHAAHFDIGQRITFKYRELSDDGVPLKASYYRKPGEEL